MRRMDPMIAIPADRPQTRPYQLVMMMSLTALLYIMLAAQMH